MARFRDQFTQIAPNEVHVEKGFNARDYSLEENKNHLESLKASIRDVGVLQPVWIRQDKDKFYLVDGETRLRAVLELVDEGLPILKIPAKIVDAGNEIERKLLSLTANQGKPLGKWEAGTAYKQLEGWGWTHEQIAERVGQTERYIREAIELSNVPQDVKVLLSSGNITTRLALKTVREEGDTAAKTLTKAVESAKAEGKTQAKASRKTKEGDIKKIIAQIANDCADEFEESQKDEGYSHVPVRAELLKKLFQFI